MKLWPAHPDDVELAWRWLSDEDNAKWLDFGPADELTRVSLKFILGREENVVRLFAPEGAPGPLGIVALSDVHRACRTANLWYVLGERVEAGRGHTTRAVSRLLGLAFGELGLASVHAWTVEANVASIRVLERNGFRGIGRQRRCHFLDGHIVDRLLFDLVREEYREVP